MDSKGSEQSDQDLHCPQTASLVTTALSRLTDFEKLKKKKKKKKKKKVYPRNIERKKIFDPFIPSGLFYLNSLDRSISYIRGIWLVFIIFMFYRNSVSKLHANSVDPDQTRRFAASDLDLHCLTMSLLWDARLKWVKILITVVLVSFKQPSSNTVR